MQGVVIAWGYALWLINMVCGALIVQHAICNLSRWQYNIRSLALWGNAMMLGGGLRVLLAFGAHENPGFGEVLINLGVALLSVRSMRRIYREYADDPKGLWAHIKSEARRILMMAKAYFAKGEK